MPQSTFPIPARELTLTVVVGMSRPETLALLAAGSPLVAPVSAAGVIDTGTNITSVDAKVIQQLGLRPVARASSQTAGGQVTAKVYRVSLTVPPGIRPGPTFVSPDMLVMELAHPLPGVEVLVGMDILLGCRFLLDGPGRQFVLDW